MSHSGIRQKQNGYRFAEFHDSAPFDGPHVIDWLNIFFPSFLTKHAIKQYKYYIHNNNNHMW